MWTAFSSLATDVKKMTKWMAALGSQTPLSAYGREREAGDDP
jgi:hypothetical protein